MISTPDAYEILGNPDGCDLDDLIDLILWVEDPTSGCISKGEEQIMVYVHFLVIARLLREKGDIGRALEFEKICQEIYLHDIPLNLRW